MRDDPRWPRWLDPEATAAYICVSPGTLTGLVKRGLIPPPAKLTKRRRRMWLRADIDAVFCGEPVDRVSASAFSRQRFQGDLLPAQVIVAGATKWPSIAVGIYFLIKRGRVVYVGQSTNIIARIAQHAASRSFGSWHWIQCTRDELNSAETQYIAALCPPWNKVGRPDLPSIQGVR